MNTPPRFFAAPPPSRRKLSLALGAALLFGWLALTTAGVMLHWPPLVLKLILLAVAAGWAVHALSVVVANRRADRPPPRP